MAILSADSMNKKEKILFVLMQLFFLSLLLPYNDVVSGFITGGLLLSCLLFNSVKEKIKLFKERKHLWWMLLFFIWMVISLFTSKNRQEIFPTFDPRVPLGYLPAAIGLISLRKDFIEKVLLGLAGVTTLICAACLIAAFRKYLVTDNVDNLYNDGLTAITTQQSIYISMFVNISIYAVAYFLFFKKIKYKALLIAGLIFLFGISYLLASRNLMIVLYTFSILFVIYYIITQKQYAKGIAILISVLVVGFAVLKFFPKTLNRFQDIGFTKFDFKHEGSESNFSTETTADQWNGANFRIAAWRCGWELVKQNPITGTHLADKQDKVFEKYKEKNFQFALKTRKNLHNNYLDILVSMGVIGLALFLMGWIVLPLNVVIHQRNYLSLFIILTFCIAMITEVYFDRSLGGMLVGFFIPFLLTEEKITH
ncbi:MAG: O-antigen ligase family protein [Bacteroidota bacterium]